MAAKQAQAVQAPWEGQEHPVSVEADTAEAEAMPMPEASSAIMTEALSKQALTPLPQLLPPEAQEVTALQEEREGQPEQVIQEALPPAVHQAALAEAEVMPMPEGLSDIIP